MCEWPIINWPLFLRQPLAYFKRKGKNNFALKFSTCEYSFAIRKLLICFSNLSQDLFCLFT